MDITRVIVLVSHPDCHQLPELMMVCVCGRYSQIDISLMLSSALHLDMMKKSSEQLSCLHMLVCAPTTTTTTNQECRQAARQAGS
mmetsp:Transcript_19338/g.46737  ORF Transcript_19338/g.46737 Transcript_19338/m.46737 type:complete len:85 (-) Transcript_19338:714-968(-)